MLAGDAAAAEIREHSQGRGADLVLDLVGADATLALAASVARTLGQLTLVGIAGGSFPMSFFSTAYEVSVATTYWGSIPELEEVLTLARAGHLTPTCSATPSTRRRRCMGVSPTGRSTGGRSSSPRDASADDAGHGHQRRREVDRRPGPGRSDRYALLDADDLHPPANVAKTASGRPLDDADREPWSTRWSTLSSGPKPPASARCWRARPSGVGTAAGSRPQWTPAQPPSAIVVDGDRPVDEVVAEMVGRQRGRTPHDAARDDGESAEDHDEQLAARQL